MIVFDTDILSTFAKINKLDILCSLFKGNKLVYTSSVNADLQKAISKGYSFVNIIMHDKNFEIIVLSKNELNYAKQIGKERRNLGFGELESLALCKLRVGVFITNDIRAQKAAEKLDITYLTLSDILHAFVKEKILSRKDTKHLIEEIESKDKVRIMDKNDILKS